MNCFVLGSIIGWFIHCKNIHGMNNTNLLVCYEARSFITLETGPNSETDETSSHPRYLKVFTNFILPWMLRDPPLRFFYLLSLRYRTLRCDSCMSISISAGGLSSVLRQGICEAVSVTLYPVLLHTLCNVYIYIYIYIYIYAIWRNNTPADTSLILSLRTGHSGIVL